MNLVSYFGKGFGVLTKNKIIILADEGVEGKAKVKQSLRIVAFEKTRPIRSKGVEVNFLNEKVENDFANHFENHPEKPLQVIGYETIVSAGIPKLSDEVSSDEILRISGPGWNVRVVFVIWKIGV